MSSNRFVFLFWAKNILKLNLRKTCSFCNLLSRPFGWKWSFPEARQPWKTCGFAPFGTFGTSLLLIAHIQEMNNQICWPSLRPKFLKTPPSIVSGTNKFASYEPNPMWTFVFLRVHLFSSKILNSSPQNLIIAPWMNKRVTCASVGSQWGTKLL